MRFVMLAAILISLPSFADEPQRIDLPEGRVREVIKKQYKIHLRDIQREANMEVERMQSRDDDAGDRRLNLPICDPKIQPAGWRYQASGDGYAFLQHLSKSREQATRLDFGEGNFIRLSKPIAELREGMSCFFDDSLDLNRARRVEVALTEELVSSTQPILQVSSQQFFQEGNLVKGEIVLSSAPRLAANVVVVELWEKLGGMSRILASATKRIGDGHDDMTRIRVEGRPARGAKVRLIVTEGGKSQEVLTDLQREGTVARLHFYDARLWIER